MTFRYTVHIKGRKHPEAGFVYARDAEGYVKSEYARKAFNAGSERGVIPLYPESDYEIRDAESDRKVVGVTGHGHAILEKLRAHDAAKSDGR